jgi:hypothetical protein
MAPSSVAQYLRRGCYISCGCSLQNDTEMRCDCLDVSFQ